MSNMTDLRQNSNLAFRIGLYRIALVVNAVFNEIKTHPAFATLFNVSESHGDEKACLTYFWWMVLGGNKLSDFDSEVIRGCGRMRISSSLFKEWLALFCQAALPIIGAELTDAWKRRAVQLADESPVTGDDDAVPWAVREPKYELEKLQVLGCSEVRGGNHKFIGTRRLAGMVAWVASIPVNEGEAGGDVHFMSVCSHDLISRIALADVSGHGWKVDSAAMTLDALLRKNINVWDQSDFMCGLNDAFSQDGDGQYATAIVLGFHRLTGYLTFSNAGHLPPLWYHASDRAWGWLEEGDPTPRKAFGLPVGLIPGTGYCQTVVTLRPSDLLVLYTDGITEAENGAGKRLGRKQLLEWAREGPFESPGTLGEQLLKRLTEFRRDRHNDDETLLVLQRKKESTPTSA